MALKSINSSIILFVAITIGYGFLKYIIVSLKSKYQNNEKQNDFFVRNFENIALVSYIILTFSTQLVSNLSYVKEICRGSSQNTFSVLIYTLFPYFIIFCSIIVLVNVFSGWLRPFSNTFGYGLVLFMGVKNLFTNLLNPASNDPLLSQIYTDKSMMINEMSPNNYHTFMEKISGSILKPDYLNMPEYKKLENMVKIKNIVSEIIWFILAGILSLTVSKSILTNYKCNYDVKTMQKMHKKLQKKEEQITAKEELDKELTQTGITSVKLNPR
tara:strand:+ start:5822 stop:6634 length:813 start_codon:yes stop_codon:yes gene_type:complete